MDWNGKVVLLTGASSGIGEQLARELAKNGAVVGLLARRGDQLTQIAREIEAKGGIAWTFQCDVRDAECVSEAAETLRKDFGHIDVLIVNAGIGGNNEATRRLEPEAVKQVIDINLLGAVNSVHAVLPAMLERGSGHLVAISSLAGFRGLPRSAAYCASKAGMTALFESIRLDVQHKGVDVTIIQPGFIMTPLTSGREAKMPYLMELDVAISKIVSAIERKKRFAAFPWQMATLVRSALVFPAFIYDRIAGRARYRE